MPAEQGASTLGLDWALNRVAAFHHLAGQPAPSTPRPLRQDRAAVRAAWMKEELDEFLEGSSVVEQSDAIIDLIYFALGTLVELGVPAESLFDIVHRANMRKLTSGEPLRRVEDGKVLKASDWLPPEEELADVLTGLTSRYHLVLADGISTLDACVLMVATLLTPHRQVDTELLARAVGDVGLLGTPFTPIFAAAGAGVVDDFEHISQIDEAVFLDRVTQALATYPAVGFAYDLPFLSRTNVPRSVEFLLAASTDRSEILVVDPKSDSPGPRAVNVDHLYSAIKSAGDGLHKFGPQR